MFDAVKENAGGGEVVVSSMVMPSMVVPLIVMSKYSTPFTILNSLHDDATSDGNRESAVDERVLGLHQGIDVCIDSRD
jgi:hypothetical protein